MGFTSSLKAKSTTATTTWCNSFQKKSTFRLEEDHDNYEESWFTNSTDEDRSSISDESSEEEEKEEEELLEQVIRGLKKNPETTGRRLSIEPIGSTNSILEESKLGEGFPFKDSEVVVVESQYPYMDFRTSMAEMVAAHHGLKNDWSCLKDLLEWYLRVNSEKSHQVIGEAFGDLILEIISSISTS